MEKWKSIQGFEGYYEISNHGNVKSLHGDGVKMLKQLRGKYLLVQLFKKGKGTTRNIHRLVAIHFIPNPENKEFVNHKDGDKYNPHFTNLEWCTCQENTIHAFASGLRDSGCVRGENNWKTNLKEEHIIQIRSMKGFVKNRQIASALNLCESTISNIQNRKSWKHVK